uniref:WD_REPEATS_REGION domain-containing protein n=1 Tax=Syphacia muris TaxID=451379 RepID=A0A0N5AR87_9BILA
MDVTNSVSERRKAFYTRVYRQSFSPNGNCDSLVAADSRSRLCVFSVTASLTQKAFANCTRHPSAYIKLQHPVFALYPFKTVLLCGDSYGYLYAYQWSSIVNLTPTSLNPRTVFEVNHFSSTEQTKVLPNELNAVTSVGDRIICGGAGDYGIRLLDPERPNKVIRLFSGHADYINELKSRSENEFLSASEDGTVRLWDTRMNEVAHVFYISQEMRLKEPGCGIGVCALDVQGSFMVCGGDVCASIWHLESQSLATVLPCDSPSSVRFTVAKMDTSKILIGGTCSSLFQFDYSGKSLATVKVTPSSLYSIESNCQPGRMMTVAAGDSQYIDVFLTLGYVSFTFNTSDNGEK